MEPRTARRPTAVSIIGSTTTTRVGTLLYNKSHTVTPPGCPPVDGVYGNCLTEQRGVPWSERHERERAADELHPHLQPDDDCRSQGRLHEGRDLLVSIATTGRTSARRSACRASTFDDLASGLALITSQVLDSRRHPEHPAHHEGLHVTDQASLTKTIRRAQRQDGRRRDPRRFGAPKPAA